MKKSSASPHQQSHPARAPVSALFVQACKIFVLRQLCPHASPAGTQAQRDELMERYRRVDLKPWSGSWLIRWVRRNDGRYSYEDEALASQLTRQLDGRR